MTINDFDPFTAPLKDINLIEAAAGTGKTWTIIVLYLRLLLESEKQVNNILVVTYTQAATAEIKERILNTLNNALLLFSGENVCNDPILEKIKKLYTDNSVCYSKTKRAILEFDNASIFTIHGFCLRVLTDYSFQSGNDFDTELSPDSLSALSEAVDDIWRREVYTENLSWVSWLNSRQNLNSSDDLLKIINPIIAKPYVFYYGVISDEYSFDFDALIQCRFDSARDCWHSSRDQIIELMLSDSSGLNRSIYPKRSIKKWASQIDFLLSHESLDFGRLDQCKNLKKFSSDFIKQKKNIRKNLEPPEHLFFDNINNLIEEISNYDLQAQKIYPNWIKKTSSSIEVLVKKIKDQKGLLSYDDLLLKLNRALSFNSKNELVFKLREQYQAALIDEFQDTDPIQYEIFDKIFAKAQKPVFYVGDPKQAIYSFRNADIFTYLNARSQSDNIFKLSNNHRSVPDLVDSVNSLFSFCGQENTFVFNGIRFNKAKCASRAPILSDPTNKSSLVFWHIAHEESNQTLSKTKARKIISDGIVAEVQRLLKNSVKIGDKNISPSDIAILVRRHSEGKVIHDALQAAGIPSVKQSTESVFHSHEAMELERILLSIAFYPRESFIRAALLTDFLGFQVSDLMLLDSGADSWDKVLEKFYFLNKCWVQNGFMPMFQYFLSSFQVLERIAQFTDSDRRLTNILHLAEYIQSAASTHFSMSETLGWIANSRTAPFYSEDDSLQRLESDENRVQIATIHASKGLQYPIVFVPFAWDGMRKRRSNEEPIFFHSPKLNNQVAIDLGSSEKDENLIQSRIEDLAESVRLLYVAVTRAQCRCYVPWGLINGSCTSPLAWLLHRNHNLENIDAITEFLNSPKLSNLDVTCTLKKLLEKSDGKIKMDSLREFRSEATNMPSKYLYPTKARVPKRKKLKTWDTGSFSSLTTGLHTQIPDFDFQIDNGVNEFDQELMLFPRGSKSGTCIHRIFELMDFTNESKNIRGELVNQVLSEFGFKDHWGSKIIGMLDNVLQSPLSEAGINLQMLKKYDRIDEMQFCYSVRNFNLNKLEKLLKNEFTHLHPAMQDSVGKWGTESLNGFMNGFIDLVFQVEDKYFIADYKSNFLGNSFEAYGNESINSTMSNSNYTLQYLIYTLALHRWLKTRIPNYSYQDNFGGVYYLFIRGMNKDKEGSGVFFDRPPFPIINEIDQSIGF